jgi:acetoin utilization protein AcuB
MQFTRPQAKSVDARAQLVEAYQLMRQLKFHHLVVVERGEMVGIVSDRQLFERGFRFDHQGFDPVLRVGDVMVPLREGVSQKSDIRSARAIMRQYQVTAVPVVDEGEVVGIVTESDLMNVLSQLIDERDNSPPNSPPPVEGFSKMLLSHPLVQSTMNTLAGIGI